MSLPLQLQMEIDLSAAAHKREVAEGFAKLRSELLPAPKDDRILNESMKLEQLALGLFNMGMNSPNPYLNGLYTRNALMPANLASQGWFGSFSPWA